MYLLMIFSVIFLAFTWLGFTRNVRRDQPATSSYRRYESGILNSSKFFKHTFLRLLLLGLIWYAIDYRTYLSLREQHVEYRAIRIESAFTEMNAYESSSYTDYIVYGIFPDGMKRLVLDADVYYVREEMSQMLMTTNNARIENYFYRRVWHAVESDWILHRPVKVEGPTINEGKNELLPPVIVVPPGTVFSKFGLR